MFTVTVPVTVPRTKKKNFALNLNIYRNAHFLVLNNAKDKFKKIIWDDLLKLPTMEGVKLTYTLFMGTNREGDLANVCCVVDKFFCDALVEAKRIADDSIKYITSIDYRFGGVDKGNPRVEVTLEPTAIKEDNTMKISLVQAEIELAIKNYISEQLNVAEGMEFKIDLAATRGEQGFTAEINIVPMVVNGNVAPRRRGRPANQDTNTETQTSDQSEEAETAGAVPETADEAEALTAEEAGVPAFLQKKSIFGGNNT